MHQHVDLIYSIKPRTNKVEVTIQEHEQLKWFNNSEIYLEEYAIPLNVKILAKEAINFK